MEIKNFPTDINAEVVLDYFPKGTFDVELNGLHKRNVYKDVLSLEDSNGRICMALGRNSLYNSLPEFLFHPIDRFDLPQYNYNERFADEYAKQEREKENAYKFFAPLDLMLLHYKVKTKHEIQNLTSKNAVLIDIITDTLTEKQKKNRFIQQSLEFLPFCKIIRGDRTLITMMLRKILMEEDIVVDVNCHANEFSDGMPRYNTEVGSELSSLYVGTEFEQNTLSYSMYYWNEDECNESFISFIDDLEEYRIFVQDFFLSIDSLLKFEVYNDAPVLRLSDTTIYNYLNYNTNI